MPLTYNSETNENDFDQLYKNEEEIIILFNDNIKDHYNFNAGGGNGKMRRLNVYSNSPEKKTNNLVLGVFTGDSKIHFQRLTDEVNILVVLDLWSQHRQNIDKYHHSNKSDVFSVYYRLISKIGDDFVTVKTLIDLLFVELRSIITYEMTKNKKTFSTLYYSDDGEEYKNIGVALFKDIISEDVIKYITKKIYELQYF
jgi:hypothetical protein